MKITVIGTGYVGLVTGTCFADGGNDVTCVDIDAGKIAALQAGKIPIYEPGLSEMVLKNQHAQRLRFTTDLATAAQGARVIFLAVGTPSGHDGLADLTAFWKAVDSLSPHLQPDTIVVVKSTVPVGTNDRLHARLRELTRRDCETASNPEFLKEGAAIGDFQFPDRVVIGVRPGSAEETLRELYAPYLRTDHPLLSMTPASAELTKYVANALLSAKISFINEMANLCERMGGDINDVRRGIGHDRRIGFAFLFPGVGYGGSCFPEDVRALAGMARELGLEPRMLDAIDEVNTRQKNVLLEKMDDHFQGDWKNRRIAVWGLAFKPRTDDIREAPALVLIDALLERGVSVRVFDPEAQENVKRQYGSRLEYAENLLSALEGADALAINTEWGDFRTPDFAAMKSRLKSPVVFDGRNLYEPAQMRGYGFKYYSIGRVAVK